MPYSVAKGKNEYPLSLKDLSLAAHVGELIDMGVASFKIEGRMKSPEYVRDVTRIWRKLIDEHRGATPAEMRELSEIFSRGGLTDGYYKEKIDSKMMGVRSERDKEITRELVPFAGLTRRVPIEMLVRIKEGSPSEIRIEPHGVAVIGDVPQKAINAPLTEEAVLKNVSKLGGTPYEATKIEIELDEGLMMPVSRINALRREAIAALTKNERSEAGLCRVEKAYPIGKRGAEKTAVFYEPRNIPNTARSYFDVIYTPLHLYDGKANGVMLPPVIYDSEVEGVRAALLSAKEQGAHHALVGNVGHLALVREVGLIPHADYRMNIFSSVAAYEIEKLGFESMIVSPELTLPQIRDIGGNSTAVIYGKVALMTLEKCAIKEFSDCASCEREGFLYLTDRKGVRFPVRREPPHRNIIFNAVPIYMADRADALAKNKIIGGHFVFTDETPAEIEKIIEAYKKGSAPTQKQIRRIN